MKTERRQEPAASPSSPSLLFLDSYQAIGAVRRPPRTLYACKTLSLERRSAAFSAPQAAVLCR